MIRHLAWLSGTFSRVAVLRTSTPWRTFCQQTMFNTEAKERILTRPRPDPRQPTSFRDCFFRTKVWAGHLHHFNLQACYCSAYLEHPLPPGQAAATFSCCHVGGKQATRCRSEGPKRTPPFRCQPKNILNLYFSFRTK